MSFALVALSAIFFVVDPIAIVPIFVAMTQNDSDEKRAHMALKACLVASGLLIFFAFFGNIVFQLFGVTLAGFKIAGGILLLLTAFDALRNHTSEIRTSGEEIAEGQHKEDIAIVPLAMPLLAGPGAIATVMVLAGQASGTWWKMLAIVVAILLTAVASYLLLRGAKYVDRGLGASGKAILHRVMGLLLAAIAVQFIITGVREAFPEILR